MATVTGVSNQALLTTHAALTHKMHAAEKTGRRRDAASYRDRRDVVEAEALRRMSALQVLRDIVGDHCEAHAEPRPDSCSYCEGVALVLGSGGGL